MGFFSSRSIRRFAVFLGTAIAVLIFWNYHESVYASSLEDTFLDMVDIGEIETELDDIFGDYDFDFKAAVLQLLKGEIPFNLESFLSIAGELLASQFYVYKQTIVQILMIVLVAAIFSNFSGAFGNAQVSEISFYIVYILLFSVLMKSFSAFTGIVTETLNGLVLFMEALIPAYFLTVAFSAGSVTAAIFYQFILILILAVQWLLSYIAVPAVNIYVILNLINQMTKEDFLSKLSALIKKAVEWMMKFLFGAVLGINVIQGLIAPAVDAVKSTALNKTASAIPGIGNALNAVTEVILGSAVLIKNAVGVAVLIGLVFLCAGPLLRLFAAQLIYKLLGALVQPVADKRMQNCISGVGEGISLLLRILSTALALFLITIALIATFTNRGY